MTKKEKIIKAVEKAMQIVDALANVVDFGDNGAWDVRDNCEEVFEEILLDIIKGIKLK